MHRFGKIKEQTLYISQVFRVDSEGNKVTLLKMKYPGVLHPYMYFLCIIQRSYHFRKNYIYYIEEVNNIVILSFMGWLELTREGRLYANLTPTLRR